MFRVTNNQLQILPKLQYSPRLLLAYGNAFYRNRFHFTIQQLPSHFIASQLLNGKRGREKKKGFLKPETQFWGGGNKHLFTKEVISCQKWDVERYSHLRFTKLYSNLKNYIYTHQRATSFIDSDTKDLSGTHNSPLLSSQDISMGYDWLRSDSVSKRI